MLRASFPAGLVIRGRSAEESWYLPLVIHRPLNASRRTADSGKLSRRITISPAHTREALIKSLSDFILAFLFNARNKSTRIASYLRRLMTQHWIKIHMKFDSAN